MLQKTFTEARNHDLLKAIKDIIPDIRHIVRTPNKIP